MYITSILLPRKVNKKEGKNKNENHNHTFLSLFPKPINITSLLFSGNRVGFATRQRSPSASNLASIAHAGFPPRCT